MPGESHAQRSLAGYSPYGRTELDTTERLMLSLLPQVNNNIVRVSGAPCRDSALHIHVSLLPPTPLSSSLSHVTEQSSLCYTLGPGGPVFIMCI